MTNLTSPQPPTIRDFTEKHQRLLFQIDGDVFEAARALPGKVLARFGSRFADMDNAAPDKQLDAITEALAMVLLPESNAVFQKRLDDLENPISLEQAGHVIEYLLEAYGQRPTEPSSPSSTGPSSPASGTSSTDAQPPQASIPATFQPTAS
ncbi:hypothetical protein OHA71_06375 [Streptomyces sp. NBC_00444]|uniref:hypothetical protein n=1 Tax=Streptomyces sp. NBC_00444 TaxID=2975744 RepID=UPI002E1EF9E2